MIKRATYIVFSGSILVGCILNSTTQKAFEVVTYAEFERFVIETGYVTDAEKYGWSIVQRDITNFSKVYGANWRTPDGKKKPGSRDLPVTQVSYNDAIAYCMWSGSRLPTYEEYWRLIEEDNREVISNYNGPVSDVNKVNVLGNVWEITSTESRGSIRLAGGSLYCSPNLCNGTNRERELYIDKYTANIHIGFAVVPPSQLR